jgi:hypothetical protein
MGLKACRGCDEIISTATNGPCPHCGQADPHYEPEPPREPTRPEGPNFRLYSDASEDILAECGKCGRVLKVPRTTATRIKGGYSALSPIRCPCGLSASRVMESAARGPSRGRSGSASRGGASRGGVRCPKCGSQTVAGGTKGFGLGKAAVGGIALGPVGLLAGLFGSKKVTVSCLSCGHRWAPKTEVACVVSAELSLLSQCLVAE